MLLSAVSVLVVAQSSSEIPEGLMNNPVLYCHLWCLALHTLHYLINSTIFEKTPRNIKCVFVFIYNFHLKHVSF